jgi:phosphate transport system substrate-binding protein
MKTNLRAVAADPDGIGISNVHYATPAVRALSILVSGVAVAPSRASVENRSYPLSRAVYMVVDRQTESAADVEFLRFVLSRQGQEAVEREGNYLPLAAEAASKQLRGLAAN